MSGPASGLKSRAPLAYLRAPVLFEVVDRVGSLVSKVVHKGAHHFGSPLLLSVGPLVKREQLEKWRSAPEHVRASVVVRYLLRLFTPLARGVAVEEGHQRVLLDVGQAGIEADRHALSVRHHLACTEVGSCSRTPHQH